jgi:hypothetical protein
MRSLQRIWQTWKRIGQFLGDVIARVVLTVFYFTLFMPFGLGVRMWGDPLGISPGVGTKWLERNTGEITLKESRRLF